MEKIINDEDVEPGEGIIHHEEGIDFIPANIELAAYLMLEAADGKAAFRLEFPKKKK